ncbi:hypothetical protein LINPERPRIM_LOCUS26946 [Linum perenne]
MYILKLYTLANTKRRRIYITILSSHFSTATGLDKPGELTTHTQLLPFTILPFHYINPLRAPLVTRPGHKRHSTSQLDPTSPNLHLSAAHLRPIEQLRRSLLPAVPHPEARPRALPLLPRLLHSPPFQFSAYLNRLRARIELPLSVGPVPADDPNFGSDNHGFALVTLLAHWRELLPLVGVQIVDPRAPKCVFVLVVTAGDDDLAAVRRGGEERPGLRHGLPLPPFPGREIVDRHVSHGLVVGRVPPAHHHNFPFRADHLAEQRESVRVLGYRLDPFP